MIKSFALVMCVAMPLAFVEMTQATAEDKDQSRSLLPKVLRSYGFGDPKQPIYVTFTGRIGDDPVLPRLAGKDEAPPRNTLWVFEDPAPVWRALSRAHTRSFAKDMFPGADARLVLAVGSEKSGRRLFLHYRQGWGSISVRKGREFSGGDWHFDAGGDRALIELLSKTPPTALGVPSRWTQYAGRRNALKRPTVNVAVARSAASLDRLSKRFVPHYAHTKSLAPSSHVQLGRDVVVATWLPPQNQKDILQFDGCRLWDDKLRFDVRREKRNERAVRWSPGALVALTVPAGARFLEVRLDGVVHTQVRFASDPDAANTELLHDEVACLIIERMHDGNAWIDVGDLYFYRGGTYMWIRPSSVQGSQVVAYQGTVPAALTKTLLASIEAGDGFMLQGGTPNYVRHIEDAKARPPKGIDELRRHVSGEHPLR